MCHVNSLAVNFRPSGLQQRTPVGRNWRCRRRATAVVVESNRDATSERHTHTLVDEAMNDGLTFHVEQKKGRDAEDGTAVSRPTGRPAGYTRRGVSAVTGTAPT